MEIQLVKVKDLNCYQSPYTIFFKELGYTKHYEDTILSHYTLTGKRPDNIEHLEEKLMADFDKLQNNMICYLKISKEKIL